MNDKFDANSYLEQAEKFQKHFVQPLIDAMKGEIQAQLEPLKARLMGLEDHSPRLAKLELNQRKAILGYSGIVFIVSVGFGLMKGKIFKWIGL